MKQRIFKNADRDAVLAAVLRESFAPRFDALQKKMADQLKQAVAAHHPVFMRLIADKETRPYVRATHEGTFVIKDHGGAVRPVYGLRATIEAAKQWKSECGVNISDRETLIPVDLDFKVTDQATIDEYKAAWADYEAAYQTLRNAVNAYKTHEAFAADFPQFAKYLPQPEPKAVENMPTVIVGDVLAELAKRGVPPAAVTGGAA